MALFYVDNNKELTPIAIQLFQEPAENNPVTFIEILSMIIVHFHTIKIRNAIEIRNTHNRIRQL